MKHKPLPTSSTASAPPKIELKIEGVSETISNAADDLINLSIEHNDKYGLE